MIWITYGETSLTQLNTNVHAALAEARFVDAMRWAAQLTTEARIQFNVTMVLNGYLGTARSLIGQGFYTKAEAVLQDNLPEFSRVEYRMQRQVAMELMAVIADRRPNGKGSAMVFRRAAAQLALA